MKKRILAIENSYQESKARKKIIDKVGIKLQSLFFDEYLIL